MTEELNKWHSRLELELDTNDGLMDRLHEWIKTGQAVSIIPRGENARQLNLTPGAPN